MVATDMFGLCPRAVPGLPADERGALPSGMRSRRGADVFTASLIVCGGCVRGFPGAASGSRKLECDMS